MAGYRFLTTWAFGPGAAIERIFDALHDAQAYPSWWKGVLAVERLEQGGVDDVGAVDRYVWKSKLPYELEFHSRPWMNVLAPVARPVFAWNHDYVMRNGGEGLASLLGVPLLLSD